MSLTVVEAGTVDYRDAWEQQRHLHRERVAGRIGDTVMLVEHPPVYTAGRRTEQHERPVPGTADAPVVDVDRGGKITWHGPGQLVGYPILKLPEPLDVVAYVRRIEAMLISVCADLGLDTTRVDGRSGVWVVNQQPTWGDTERKVAAIGIRVSRGVAMHGFALNCDPDLTWFTRIVACGIPDAGVTSLTRELGRTVTTAEASDPLRTRLAMLRPQGSTRVKEAV